MIPNRHFNNPRINEFFELYHITVSILIANKTLVDHDRFSKKKYKRDVERCASRRQLSVSRKSWVRKARSALDGGLRGPSDALSYWSTTWDLVVPPPFGCRCSESTRPRGLSSPTNRKKRGLQVQRVRRIVHATQRALFKLKLKVCFQLYLAEY